MGEKKENFDGEGVNTYIFFLFKENILDWL